MWNTMKVVRKEKSAISSLLGTIRGITLLACACLNLSTCITFAKGHSIGASVVRAPLTEQETEAAKPMDPQVRIVLDKMAAAGILHLTTVDQVRKAYLFYPKLSGTPERVFRVDNRTIPGPAGNIPIRIYTPHEGSEMPILVFFHGGGFVAGSLDTHDTPLRAVANRCGCIIVSVAYRLAPANPYPAAPDDAYAATKWIAEHAAELKGDAHLIAVGGDGAGGNLAAVVTLMSRDRGGPKIVYQVLIYPTLDALMEASRYLSKDPILTPDLRMAILAAYVPLTQGLRDPYISPVSAKSLKNLPAALVVTDADDPARDEGDAYARDLAEDGVPVRVSRYPNMIHNFFLMAGELDAAKKCIDEIGSALAQVFQSKPAASATQPSQ